MKLRSLSVNQFKKFNTPQVLDEFDDELNIVVGPNELGKSTLLDALRAVLFERYGSKAQAIQRLQNDRSQAAPVVELEFDINGAAYTLTKRFMKREFAQLQCPDGTLLEADAAEEELRRLLGFQEAGSRGANPESLGMWGVLWVQQGESFGRPVLAESAQASLSGGLQSEVGEVLGGRRGRELPQVIEKSLNELVTAAQKRPRGRYKDSQDRVDELRERLDDQYRQQGEIADTVEQLEAAQRHLRDLESGDQDQRNQREIDDARNELRRVEQHQLKIDAAQSELENRNRQLQQARDALTTRESRQAEIVAAQRERDQAARILNDLQERETEAQQRANPLQETLRAAAAGTEAAERDSSYWRHAVDVISRAAELATLQQRQEEIEGAIDRLAAARRSVAEINVDDQLMRRIRAASTALDRANTGLTGAATRVRFEFAADGIDGVEIDGALLTDPFQVLNATEPTVITIPERGQIVVEPALTDVAQLRIQQRDAVSALNEALAEAGAESLAAAEVQRDERRDREARVDAAVEEVDRLGANRDEVAHQLNTLEGWRNSLADEWQPMLTHDRADADAKLRTAEERLEHARGAQRNAQSALDQRRQSLESLSGEIREQRGMVDYATDLSARRLSALDDEEARTPMEALQQAVGDADTAMREQQGHVDLLLADFSPNSAELLQVRIDRLEEAIKARDRRRGDLASKISRLRGMIEAQEGAGIDETIENTARELDQASERVARYEREVAVLELLSLTLREAELEAKERYLAPVLGRVRPYLQMLFPQATIDMDEQFNIVGISRQSGYEEGFERLSMGTQEQIVVLVRLAFAEMLVDQGAPAAVILDDALVFSDDRRMQLMFDILAHAAKRVQIIVFTCREQLFEGLGARQLQLRPGDPDSLRSA